ncbi:MAG: c-type cytochrome [Acidobacteria bacterium]|nr:c-type cytochrome [Acidobacteriota bacterium]MCA1627148.1 c-type cytochrome [Acidobacteriota bacterium]
MFITLRLMAFALLLVVTVLFASAFRPATLSAQNTNSSTTNKNQNQNDTKPATPPAAAKAPEQDFSKNTWELPDDADKTKNPVASSPESIVKGKELYLARDKGNCTFCHGEAGSGNEANLARLRRKPADLTNKERMTAMSDGELFWKVSKGITGIMPAGERRMSEEERWHVVNYIRTLAKDKQ